MNNINRKNDIRDDGYLKAPIWGFGGLGSGGLFLFLLLFTSCNDFLSTLPDNRTMLDSKEKISQLLVSAYPSVNYATLAELSSDNFVDNNAVLPVLLTSLEQMDDQVYAWEEVTASTDQDSPSDVWGKCYAAIAAANHALKAIQELRAANPDMDLDAQEGEALICRAYGHFILVNIFSQAYKDDVSSTQDMGIPYATEPETKVNGMYSRETVTSVYQKIQQDLETGIAQIDEQVYKVAKYHFDKKAACAFAARFFLYKRDYNKVLQYANWVLGADPTPLMRNWNKDYSDPSEIGYDYINSELPCNLLIMPTLSTFYRLFGMRYGHNGEAMYGSTYGRGPTWNGSLPCFNGKLYISVKQDYGVLFPKCYEMFEYTDKIAGIGYTHVTRAEFTAEETLLCRAEALVYLNRIPEAVADLQVWNKSHQAPDTLTGAAIRNFYKASNTLFVKKLNAGKMSPSFTVTSAQEPYIHCILHFRRIETMFDGYRWFDLKRYGIEIKHAIGLDRTETLVYNDPRRAIQLPKEVIGAGMVPNPREFAPLSPGAYTLFVVPETGN
ncbi:MAG TPA: RagB/SusD family nutrient uptake outer membrane protein [Paludibacter sp.]|nr:RagB/SusD family nutrient uptake outer membrane protein [Paludibacter sp.]